MRSGSFRGGRDAPRFHPSPPANPPLRIAGLPDGRAPGAGAASVGGRNRALGVSGRERRRGVFGREAGAGERGGACAHRGRRAGHEGPRASTAVETTGLRTCADSAPDFYWPSRAARDGPARHSGHRSPGLQGDGGGGGDRLDGGRGSGPAFGSPGSPAGRRTGLRLLRGSPRGPRQGQTKGPERPAAHTLDSGDLCRQQGTPPRGRRARHGALPVVSRDGRGDRPPGRDGEGCRQRASSNCRPETQRYPYSFTPAAPTPRLTGPPRAGRAPPPGSVGRDISPRAPKRKSAPSAPAGRRAHPAPSPGPRRAPPPAPLLRRCARAPAGSVDRSPRGSRGGASTGAL